jgi:hypothetical protein
MAAQGAQDGSSESRMSTIAISSSFVDETQCSRAIEDLRAARVGDFHTFSPIPSHKIEHAIGRPKSPVRWLVLTGGILGVLTGLAITVGTTFEWRLNAGGKPLLSWPPFIVICFEMMVLLGGIFGFFGVLTLSGVPTTAIAPGYDGRFGEDRFGIVVRCDETEASRVESMLKESGAEEVVRC